MMATGFGFAPQAPENLRFTLDNINQANALGETGLHEIFQSGNIELLERIKRWVDFNQININSLTTTFSNPFHYLIQVTCASALEIGFSMATPELISAKNQTGWSPLLLAIKLDNHHFFELCINKFPELLSLKVKYGHHYFEENLMHLIAEHNAISCFNVLARRFKDKSEWLSLLTQHDINNMMPEQIALDNNHRELFQLFKGYRDEHGPKLMWLGALEIAKQTYPPTIEHLAELLADASMEHELEANDVPTFYELDEESEESQVEVEIEEQSMDEEEDNKVRQTASYSR